MRKIFLFILLHLGLASALAQVTQESVSVQNFVPTGLCTVAPLVKVSNVGTYQCVNSLWTKVGPGGGTDTFDPASPGPIGGTTPDIGNFTLVNLRGSHNGAVNLTYRGAPATTPAASSVQLTLTSDVPTPYQIPFPSTPPTATNKYMNCGSTPCVWDSGGAASVSIEHTAFASGTLTFAHNLGTTNPIATCYSKSSVLPSPPKAVDANNVTVTVSGAATIDCAFVYVPSAVATPDFALSAAPPTASVTGPATTAYTVTQVGVSGYAGTATYSVTGLPTGVTAVFAPTTVTGSGSTVMTVTIPSGQAASTSTLVVTGSDGTLTHTTNVSLVVTAVVGGLTHKWAMGEGAGSTLTDSIGGANLTTQGVTWTSGTALFSGAFHASGAIASTVGSPVFSATSPFSISFWVTPTSLTNTENTQMTFVSNENIDVVTPGIEILYSNSGSLTVAVVGASGTAVVIESATGLLTAGVQVNLILTFDGTGKAAGTKFYLNGAQVTMATDTDNLTGAITPTLPFSVMCTPTGGTANQNNVPGSMEFLGTYDIALSASQALAIAQAGPN